MSYESRTRAFGPTATARRCELMCDVDEWVEILWKIIFACGRCGLAKEFYPLHDFLVEYPLDFCPQCGKIANDMDWFWQEPFQHPRLRRIVK